MFMAKSSYNKFDKQPLKEVLGNEDFHGVGTVQNKTNILNGLIRKTKKEYFAQK